MKKLLISLAFIISFATLFGYQSSATTHSEQIDRFDSQITIGRDNSATIVETIVYNYGANSRHGIYRDVPIDYKDGIDNYYLNFRLIDVAQDSDNSIGTELSTENGNKRIKIGDANKTITGMHTYQISYNLSPIVIQKDSKPFLNLDVIGEGWNVPINNVSANITLEDGALLNNVVWYGAENLSTTSSEIIASMVAPYSGLTINANLPDEYVQTYLKPNVKRSGDILAEIINIVIFVVVAFTFLLAIAVIVARSLRTRKRRRGQIVVAQYEPPVGMSPAHIGLLQDDVSDNKEITATVIDWAVKDYIKIVYLPKKSLFGSKDYQLVKLKSPNDLSAIDLPLFEAFFGGADEIKLSKLNKVAVSAQITKFKAALKDELTNLGYYDKEGNVLMRGTLSEAGAKQWALVDGFKLYLSVVEKDRLKFSDAPDKTPERFNKLLPYAIALGVEKQWAKQFEGIDLTTSTSWYSGNLATFSAVAIASDLSGSFASTVSSNSSVNSGGGSSGGGFGGGGGGSW